MNVASSKKGTIDSKKMINNPKCVNVKKVALYQKGYKCLLDWSLNRNHIYILEGVWSITLKVQEVRNGKTHSQ